MAEQRAERVVIGLPSPDQVRLFRFIAGLSTAGAVIALLSFAVMGAIGPTVPLMLLGPPVGVFILGDLVALWLSYRGRHRAAVLLHMVFLTAALYVVIHFANGSTGPFAVVLVAIPILAGLFSGGRAAFWMALVTIVSQTGLFALEYWDVLPSRDILGGTLPWVDLGTLLTVIVILASIVSVFAEQVRSALALAQQRGNELVAATARAERAALAEREARLREEGVSQQLRQAVQRFVAFLERVSAGDYAVRLPLDELPGGASSELGSDDLRMLGSYLNATVESLTEALVQMQTLQDRYTREAWTAFVRSGRASLGTRYENGRVRPSGESWLALMPRAVASRALVVEGAELAVPIMLGGEVIGVLGAVRAKSAGREPVRWRDQDLTVIQAAADQLAQTIEALRLLDQTQQSAAREQLALRVSEQVRSAVDIEEILRVVSHTMGRELGASEVVVRLGTEPALLTGERTYGQSVGGGEEQ